MTYPSLMVVLSEQNREELGRFRGTDVGTVFSNTVAGPPEQFPGEQIRSVAMARNPDEWFPDK